MRRTHQQIVEQKSNYVARRIQESAKQMADFRAKKFGVDASTLIQECIDIKTKEAHIFEKAFDRDFGPKTKKASTSTTAKKSFSRADFNSKEEWEDYQIDVFGYLEGGL